MQELPALKAPHHPPLGDPRPDANHAYPSITCAIQQKASIRTLLNKKILRALFGELKKDHVRSMGHGFHCHSGIFQ